jgi:hypothetical protein
MAEAALMELVRNYSTSSSSDGKEESAQLEPSKLADKEDCSSDDVISGCAAVMKRHQKSRSYLDPICNSNYFASPARQPSTEEKVQIAKDFDSSHVLHPKGKLSVWVVPPTERDKAQRKIYKQKRRDEAKVAAKPVQLLFMMSKSNVQLKKL